MFTNFNKTCQELTFSELSRKIKEYINWYNFKRIRL
ncbi:IS3 family transposase [Mycoplasmopsis felis]